MLNGLDPIILFNFKKKLPDFLTAVVPIPFASREITITLPVIPIYLSERLTGLYIDTEDKNVDIDTTIDTTSTGGDPNVSQKGLNSSVKITMKAVKGSIGAALMAALADLVFPKVTSKEYSITYLHGAVILFDGLLHSFSINQDSGTDLYTVNIELIKQGGSVKEVISQVARLTAPVPL